MLLILSKQGKLEFCQTFENSEISPLLIQANEKIKGIKLREKKEAFNVLNTKSTESLGEHLFGELPPDTTNQPEYPLFDIFSLNIIQQSGNNVYGQGTIVGWASVKDTATINSYLSYPEIKNSFPLELKLLWGTAFKGAKGESIFSLHSVCSPLSQDSRLTGKSIIKAAASVKDGISKVDITMNDFGAYVWAQMTKEASSASVINEPVKKCIAIILDDVVLSAPRVMEEIKNGKSQITGMNDLRDAENLANLILSGELDAQMKARAVKVEEKKGFHF